MNGKPTSSPKYEGELFLAPSVVKLVTENDEKPRVALGVTVYVGVVHNTTKKLEWQRRMVRVNLPIEHMWKLIDEESTPPVLTLTPTQAPVLR